MTEPTTPFALPQTLAANLDRVKAHWSELLRGSAEMPFADDLSLETVQSLGSELALVEVFTLPERFRFSYIDPALTKEQTTELEGKFLDEVNLSFPLEFLRSQSSATVEIARPTFYCHQADQSKNQAAYSRLILPLWGDGHISMLLVANNWD